MLPGEGRVPSGHGSIPFDYQGAPRQVKVAGGTASELQFARQMWTPGRDGVQLQVATPAITGAPGAAVVQAVMVRGRIGFSCGASRGVRAEGERCLDSGLRHGDLTRQPVGLGMAAVLLVEVARGGPLSFVG
jgi:hypothetical protein